MKRLIFIVASFTCVFFFVQCQKAGIPDPQGTMQINIRNVHWGGDYFTPIGYDKGFGLSGENFFWGENNSYSFLDVGKVKGIGEITQFPDIPSTYWNIMIEAKRGHGYIGAYFYTNYNIQTVSVNFFRLYVDEYLINSGKISGATLKFHYPFIPKQDATTISVDKTELFFPLVMNSDLTRDFITITDPLLSWTAVSSEKWCGLYAGMNFIQVRVPTCCLSTQNIDEIRGKTATITIKMAGFQDRIINVKMADKQ